MPLFTSLPNCRPQPRSSSVSTVCAASRRGRDGAIVLALVATLMSFAPGLAAQERLEVELQAPSEVRPLLERHLRIPADSQSR